MDQDQQNRNFCKEIEKIMEELDNANVLKDPRNKLNIWNTIFQRFLHKDGQMVLYVHNGMRSGTKIKIEDALRGRDEHPIINSARTLIKIIDRIECGNFNPNEIEVPFQL